MQRDQLSERQPSDHPARLPWWKRAIDIVCGIVALPVLGLLSFAFGVVALTVAKGPIFFWQENIGPRGRRVRLYRFRTMRVRSTTPDRAIPPGADVLIPGGQFLRRSGLAELPRIINVLRGEMSVVGPRPVLERETAVAPTTAAVAVPGLTGLWRVSQRARGNADEAAEMDRFYAASPSWSLDAKIILRSIPLMVRNAMGQSNAKSAEQPGRGNPAAHPRSLRTPSQQPW